MITPDGIKYEPEKDELYLPFDMPMQIYDYKREFPDYRDPVQREHRIEAINTETKVILHDSMGWCAVINGFLLPLEDFLRGPLRKPTIEVQARAAFESVIRDLSSGFSCRNH